MLGEEPVEGSRASDAAPSKAWKAWDKVQLAILRAVPLKALLSLALEQLGTYALAPTPNTQLFNMTGQPAISLPLFDGEDGLPLAVQLAGRPAGEAELLALAAQLESARPWSGRRPPPTE